MADNKLRNGTNQLTISGKVSEYNISIRDYMKTCNIDGEDTKVKTQWVFGKIRVEVEGDIVDCSFSMLDTTRHKKNGDEGEQFKGIMTALGYSYGYDEVKKTIAFTKDKEPLMPMIDSKIEFIGLDKNVYLTDDVKASSEPSRVTINSKLAYNIQLNKDGTDLSFRKSHPVKYITKSKASTKDEKSFTIEGMLTNVEKIADTDKYELDITTPTFNDNVETISLTLLPRWDVTHDDGTVETLNREQVWDEDRGFFKTGDSVIVSGELQSFMVGQKKQETKGGFGGGAKTQGGFSVTEWVIKSGDTYEGTNNVFDAQAIQNGLNERELYLKSELDRQIESREKREADKTNASSNSNDFTNVPKTENNPFNNASKTKAPNPFAPK